MRKPVNGVWVGLKKYDLTIGLLRVMMEIGFPSHKKAKKVLMDWLKCSRGYAPIARNHKSPVFGKIAKYQPR